MGGVESYLHAVVPELLRAGHDVALWYEVDRPADRPTVAPPSVPSWCAEELGTGRAIAELRRWRPDVIYAHGYLDPAVECEVLAVAPAVFFVHSYYGTCISGRKTLTTPVPTPCSRVFGPGCLLHFYPNRCGGLSPITMVKDYHRQSERLKLLARYALIMANSTHMRDEYIRHGISAELVTYSHLPAPRAPDAVPAQHREDQARDGVHSSTCTEPDPRRSDSYELLFIGRMDRIKGGLLLLDALPLAAERLGRTVHLTFAGHGPDRPEWERRAQHLLAAHPGVRATFAGWADGNAKAQLLSTTDLLVVPSIWPEPFGLVGIEAGLRGVPVAAFDVGGISAWLTPGLNGYLAPATPPTAEGLAAAIVRCLDDRDGLARLRAGARARAGEFTMERHMNELSGLLERAAFGG